jgi:hypothetical protein
MSKETKRMLMTVPKSELPFMKKMMIEAEMAEAKAKQAVRKTELSRNAFERLKK